MALAAASLAIGACLALAQQPPPGQPPITATISGSPTPPTHVAVGAQYSITVTGTFNDLYPDPPCKDGIYSVTIYSSGESSSGPWTAGPSKSTTDPWDYVSLTGNVSNPSDGSWWYYGDVQGTFACGTGDDESTQAIGAYTSPYRRSGALTPGTHQPGRSGMSLLKWVLGSLFTCAMAGASARPPHPSKPTVIARVVSEDAGSHASRQVYMDGASWRVDALDPSGSVQVSYRYDGNPQGLVWSYSPGTRFAMPAIQSIMRRLRELASRDGLERLHSEYGVPLGQVIGRPSKAVPDPPGLDILYEDPAVATDGWPTAEVAGRPCYVRTVRLGPDGAEFTERMWVDRDTGLVLRLERQRAPAVAAQVGPGYHQSSVVRIRFGPKISRSEFELPAGTEVSVPRIFGEVPVPPGCQVKALAPEYADTGIDFRPKVSSHVAGDKAHRKQ